MSRLERFKAARLLTMYTNSLACSLLWVMVNGVPLSADDAAGLAKIATNSAIEQAVTLDAPELTESSGLAFSRRKENRLWSHNDSGGQPILYCFDYQGRKTGQVELPVRAVDWEDMAAFTDAGMPRLLVADSGDNGKVRESISLHLFDEPDPDSVSKPRHFQSMIVTFASGPIDCEAIAVDIGQRQIVMIAKTLFSPATVYTVPIPNQVANPDSNDERNSRMTAKEIKRLALPLVTGMDFDAVSGDLWVTSYFQAFRFRSVDSKRSLGTLLDQSPEQIALPPWKQIEAIAVDSQAGVWVTSEGVPARFGRLPSRNSSEPELGLQE